MKPLGSRARQLLGLARAGDRRLTCVSDPVQHRAVDSAPSAVPKKEGDNLARETLFPASTATRLRLRLVCVEQDPPGPDRAGIRTPSQAREALMNFLGPKDREHF